MIMLARRRIIHIDNAIETAAHNNARGEADVDTHDRRQLIVEHMRRVRIDNLGVHHQFGGIRATPLMLLVALLAVFIALFGVDVDAPHHDALVKRASHEHGALLVHVLVECQARHGVVMLVNALMQLGLVHVPHHKRVVLEAARKTVLPVLGGGETEIAMRQFRAEVRLSNLVVLLALANLDQARNGRVLALLNAQLVLLPTMHVETTIAANHIHIFVAPRETRHTHVARFRQMLRAIIFHDARLENRV
mmetsp:Transcript_595/g.1125  ORF Transcript_595/g.1125 Transcript_595/m.1125 type:complete len:249 (+) Transcript_595:765-1511(+)